MQKLRQALELCHLLRQRVCIGSYPTQCGNAPGSYDNLWSVLAIIAVLFCLAFGLTNLGLIIAWRMQSTQGFHAIMNLILIPIWLLSGAFFPITGVPVWLEWVMRINPLTYGMAALRRCLYLSSPDIAGDVPALAPSLGVTLLFLVVSLGVAVYTAKRSTL